MEGCSGSVGNGQNGDQITRTGGKEGNWGKLHHHDANDCCVEFKVWVSMLCELSTHVAVLCKQHVSRTRDTYASHGHAQRKGCKGMGWRLLGA